MEKNKKIECKPLLHWFSVCSALPYKETMRHAVCIYAYPYNGSLVQVSP